MRRTQILSRVVLAVASGALLLVLGGCPTHGDFPTQLSLVEAPAPSSFVIAPQGIDQAGAYQYDLSWSISDATNVDHYRLYLVGVGLSPELVHETDANETSGLFLPIKLPFNAAGLQFGLSTVSTGFVESSITAATVPDSLATN